ERPDVDRVYMTFVQATTGGGGWPMSVWLTPDLKPFVGGTYFPSEDRYGQPGFKKFWSESRPLGNKITQKSPRAGPKLLRRFANHNHPLRTQPSRSTKMFSRKLISSSTAVLIRAKAVLASRQNFRVQSR
ncbi:MAG TPA: DUF255 domain-containing protein, partial [Chthoniobacterales bacterium]|nr:DUF255 domain-containing protein [Chthoniobacterales bacterium]